MAKGTRLSVQRFCEEMVNDPSYRHGIKVRLLEGTLPNSLETMIWHYAAGKPTEHVEMNVSEKTDLSKLTASELAERARVLQEFLAQTSAPTDPQAGAES